MSRVLVCLVALGLVASAASAQPPARDTPDTPDAVGTAIIRGRVTLAGGNQPVARADVRASSPALKTPRAVKTDANGQYEITELPAGKYVVSVVKPNFVTATFGQKRPLGPGAPFELADRQIAANVNVALARSGVIAGRVLDEFGDPAADVQVATAQYRYVNGERRLMPAQGRTTTNDIGEFRLFGLAPGDYFVSAVVNRFMMNAPNDTDEQTGYAPTYYPGTGNIAEAQRIAIAPGQVVSGLSIALQAVRTVKVSGSAMDASGKPMANGMVLLMGREIGLGMMGRSGPVKADGTFTIAGVPPGDYILRWASMNGDSESTMPVTVGTTDMSDVQLVATAPSIVSGRVAFDSTAAAPKASMVRILLVRPDPMMNGSGNATLKDDFTFETKAPPGHALLRVGANGPNEWRLKSVVANGQDVTDSGIDIPANGVVPNVVLTMTTSHAEISGAVVGDDGAPQRDCWVIVFAQDAQRWTPQSRYLAVARPGQANRFQVRVLPGDYYAIAFDNFDVEQGEWTDPAFLARVRDRALAFSVADGDKKSLDLKLSPAR